MVIPRDYPKVSTEVADRTTLGSLSFTELCAVLHINPLPGWCIEPDKKQVAALFGCACLNEINTLDSTL